MGQRGGSHRHEEVHVPQRSKALLAEEMDRRTHLLMVGTEQEDEQGLREAARELGSFHLRGYEPPDGEAIGPLMRLFRQFQGELRRRPLPRTWVNKPS